MEHGGGKSNYILDATASTSTWGEENGGGGRVISQRSACMRCGQHDMHRKWVGSGSVMRKWVWFSEARSVSLYNYTMTVFQLLSKPHRSKFALFHDLSLSLMFCYNYSV